MNAIILTDKGIGCIEAPDPNDTIGKYGAYFDNLPKYKKELEAAMKNVVLFKDQKGTIKDCYNLFDTPYIEKGKLYPVPENYEIKLEDKVCYFHEDPKTNLWKPYPSESKWTNNPNLAYQFDTITEALEALTMPDRLNDIVVTDIFIDAYAILVPKQESVKIPTQKELEDYLTVYREWTKLRAWIKRWKHEVTPEKFQDMKKKERELLAKLNKML